MTVADGASVAAAEISAEFPGCPVDRRFAFRFGPDGRITELTIRP